jgi:hypothetical protein
MDEGIKGINRKISSFNKRYYLNLLIRGGIFTASAILFYFIIASLIEYNLWLGRGARFLLFTSFFLLTAYCVLRFLREPLAWWIYKKGLKEEDSARLIGTFFPSIGDKLLNVIQLATQQQPSALLQAGIAQKSATFKDISFETAIDLKENRQYLKYFLVPIFLFLILWIINQGIFTQSTTRIIKFNQEFTPAAPFRFVVENSSLYAFFNEDFTLTVRLEGEAIPIAAYVLSGAQRWKMESAGSGVFQYTFEKIQSEQTVQIEASGFYSDKYFIRIVNRPELTKLKVSFNYPSYLNRKPSELTNAGNLEVPEGTRVTWQIGTSNTAKASIFFLSHEVRDDMQLIDNEAFVYSRPIKDPDQYSIILENEKSKNKDQISYSISVIKDQYPQIAVQAVRDSVLYKNIYLGGAIADDYGLTSLQLKYQISREGRNYPAAAVNVPIAPNQSQQNFFYSWNLDSLRLQPGDLLTYFFQVWDNDGVNGRKSTRSANYTFNLPSQEELKTDISNTQQSAENRIDQSIKKAKDLRLSIEDAQQKLKGKQSLDYQDRKMLEDLIRQREKLDQLIDALQKENELLERKKESFTEENERIREKSEQIQKLMNELLDEETKKLFQELEKLLKETTDANQIQKLLEKLDRKEINLEKELERTLQLFKQLQYDFKLEQALQELEEQTEKQEQLLSETEKSINEKSENKNDKSTQEKNEGKALTPEELAKEQEKLQEDFEKFEQALEELDKLGEELKKEDSMPSEEEKEEIKDAQQKSKEELQKNRPRNSAEQQKKSINKMKQMQQKMESMQSEMEMEMDMANLESLRQIIHGLIKLSFDQENIMKEFSAVQQTDPRYVALSQNQLKLKDDAKVLEDSLLSLAKKDPFMGSFVTKEVGELNDHIDKAVENVKERRKGNASTEMQFSMTSINNLALMLNDHFNMMMDMLANAMPGKGKKKGKSQPKLSEMQMMLNQQIEEIKKGGKSGRELSEELARMAAEQERIRRALQEMQEKLQKEGGQIPGNDLPGKMEQTEFDLVNKQITEQTIRRQKEILTRLLDAEKSMREQDLDEERKGETAKDYHQQIPKAFEEYLKMKEKEVELLKTMPPKLFPYYKKEVTEYFKRIGNQE